MAIKRLPRPRDGDAAVHAGDECLHKEGRKPCAFGRYLLHALQLRAHPPRPSLHRGIAQSDDQKGVEIVQGGVAAPWVFQVFEAGNEPIQHDLPGAFDTHRGRIDPIRAGQALSQQSSEFEVRFAWLLSILPLRNATSAVYRAS